MRMKYEAEPRRKGMGFITFRDQKQLQQPAAVIAIAIATTKNVYA